MIADRAATREIAHVVFEYIKKAPDDAGAFE